MAEKIKRNEYGECVFSEQHVIDLLYQDPELDISKLFLQHPEQYNDAVKKTSVNFDQLQGEPNNQFSAKDMDEAMQSNWHMPQQYKDMDVLEFLLEKCSSDIERDRVQTEYKLFEKKKFVNVLRFLIFMVERLRENNIVWGVGRGSSVASYCLFLIGVHKINSIRYNLDHKEFLR